MNEGLLCAKPALVVHVKPFLSIGSAQNVEALYSFLPTLIVAINGFWCFFPFDYYQVSIYIQYTHTHTHI